ncbi:hypothetical protein [uncultured Paenibacillus sp.]|uniref:hypothetical protein n=1 Tax=uncultured Paenibacillus sp. TaxID=227322 RepID=UPI0025D42C15|nr:hypothetical protein [uncultured Paenibacillus sp.]
MSPHPEEMLHSYIILGLFAPSRRETGEIAAVLQDSLSAEVVHIKLLYYRRILLTEYACQEKTCSCADWLTEYACQEKTCSNADWLTQSA